MQSPLARDLVLIQFNMHKLLSILATGLIAFAALPALGQEAPERQAPPQPQPADVSDLQLEPGLSLRVYDVGENMSRLPNLVEGQTGNVNKLVKRLDLGNDDFGGLKDQFYAEVGGFLVVNQAGEYEFELSSDDGSALWLGDVIVINHDGLHSAEMPAEDYVTLEPGTYPILLRMFESGGDAALTLKWRGPGDEAFSVLEPDVLRTEANQVRVTSPGQKQVEIPDEPIELRRRPGDRRPLLSVHPAFDLIDLRPEGFEPKIGGIDFLPDGRMVVCLWDPSGDVLILENVTGDDVEASEVKVTQFATGMAEPLGVKVVEGDDGEPRIFVLQKHELTELIDTDDDGTADVYRNACSGWPVTDNFHEFAFGLAHKDGKLYANLAVAINPGGATTDPQIPGRGTCIAIDYDNGTYETVAAGLRTPNGIGIGVDGEIFITDNQGDWLPSSKLLHLKENAFYNSYINPPHPLSENPVTPPVAWLPQGEIGNSPSNPTLIPDSWGPYAGQMMHGDVTHGGVKRVFIEEIDGAYQGCVFRFTQGLEAGVNRIDVGPDNDLYVGGIGSSGNWGQEGKKPFGLQKLSYNGDIPFEMLAVRPGNMGNRHGIEIEFTKPLAEGSGETNRSYRLRQWGYEPSQTYGGPKIDVSEIDVERVHVSADRRRAWLELSTQTPLQEGNVVYVVLRSGGRDEVLGEGNQSAWTTEAWYTLNTLPDRHPEFAAANNSEEQENMTQANQIEEGFTPLFDGTDQSATANWRGFKKDNVPEQWQVKNGQLTLTEGGAGDLITKEQYADFDLRLEWNISKGGNSGVIYRVAEEGPNTSQTYTTGFEMQILDDEAHPNSRRKQLSGAIYDLYEVPDPSPFKPAGEWNESRIVVNDGKIEHYLNGELVGKTDLNSDDWKDHLAASKFADWPRFGKVERGHIALQDHGGVVHFRNIRIKPLD